MKNFKFTGVNIAAALLVIAFFFPWVSAMGQMSMSGFSITTTGISPGMLSMVLNGLTRVYMILIALVPICGGLIVYQNITGNLKFDKYYKPAHLAPAALLVIGLLVIYFKLQPDAAGDFEGYSMRHTSRMLQSMAPGLFDVLGIGVYASLAASVYLLLVGIGKVKDKEYYKTSVPVSAGTETKGVEN